MKLYVFIYNVVSIKADLSELAVEKDSKIILIGSEYCYGKLSDANQAFFNEIYHIKRNFHQPDFDEIESILSPYLKQYQPCDINLLTNEDSTQLVCAKLREKYHIPGPKACDVLPYVNKDASKNKLVSKVPLPIFKLFDKPQYRLNPPGYIRQIIKEIGFPMFIKPIDLVSSMGTYKIEDEATLESVLSEISTSPWQYEIDEYIEGDLYHCDLVVHKNKPCFFMAAKYANPLAKFSKGSPMGSIPVVDESLLKQLKTFSLSVLDTLGRFSSAFHIEVFHQSHSNKLIFLEAAARTPGALVPEMYEKICNYHLELMHYSTQVGYEYKADITPDKCHAGWITYPKIKGRVADIILPEIGVNHEIIPLVCKGDKLQEATTLLDSAVSVVFWDSSFVNVKNTFEALKKHQPLSLTNIG